MKKHLILGLLALCLAFLAGFSAHADPVTVTNGNGLGDVILNFTQTGGTKDLEVDLGSVSAFLSGTFATGSPVSLSNFLNTADLVSAFGSSWDSSSDQVYWSVAADVNSKATFGVNKFTLFASVANGGAVPVSDNSNSTGDGNLLGELSGLSSMTATGDSNDHAGLVPVGNSTSYDVESGVGGTESLTSSAGSVPSGGYYGITDFPTTSFQNQTNNGTTTSGLYELVNVPGTAGSKVGIFSLSSSGMTFQSVPEPSTWMSLIFGASTLIGMRWRRRS